MPSIRICRIPKEQHIKIDAVYEEISRRTGYTKKDIKIAVRTFHHVLADEFAAGKTFLNLRPFYAMMVRKYSARILKCVDGTIKKLPPYNRVIIRSYSVFNDAKLLFPVGAIFKIGFAVDINMGKKNAAVFPFSFAF